MAKTRKKKRKPTKPVAVLDRFMRPTPEQLANDLYDHDFVTHAESATKVKTYRRKDSNVVDKWIREGAVGFGVPAQRAIADCVILWQRMGSQRLTGSYGERLAASTNCQGHTQQEAADEISFRKSLVPREYWDVFENVLRHNEPAGTAGSRFANNPAQQIASARAIVGFVANLIAMRCGY